MLKTRSQWVSLGSISVFTWSWGREVVATGLKWAETREAAKPPTTTGSTHACPYGRMTQRRRQPCPGRGTRRYTRELP